MTTLINDFSKEVKLIPTKGLTKNLINGYGIFDGEKYFPDNGSQNYLIFQPVCKHVSNIYWYWQKFAWKSSESSEESIRTLFRSVNGLVTKLTFIYNRGIGTKFIWNNMEM